MSIARKEAQRFEAQLSEAQRAARERAQAAEAPSSKGKERDMGGEDDLDKERSAVEGDEGAAVEDLEERARKSRSDSRSEPMVMGTGEAIFDVDGHVNEERLSMDQTLSAAKQNAQTALHNVQSFWDRLQADPRLNSMQASLAKTLESVSLPKAAAAGEGGSQKTIPAVSFAEVTKQFQSSFPHLNWKESQALAKKYYDASENVARDWGKEMNALMGDLVKIVPPEEQAKGAKPTERRPAPSATTTTAEQPTANAPVGAVRKGEGSGKMGVEEEQPTHSTHADTIPAAPAEEEDFDWDGDMDGQPASAGLQTTSGPLTTSWEGGSSEGIHGIKSQGATSKSGDDDGAESDWE